MKPKKRIIRILIILGIIALLVTVVFRNEILKKLKDNSEDKTSIKYALELAL